MFFQSKTDLEENDGNLESVKIDYELSAYFKLLGKYIIRNILIVLAAVLHDFPGLKPPDEYVSTHTDTQALLNALHTCLLRKQRL